jgi:hypothetical protein
MKYIFIFFVGGLFLGCFNEGDCLITATNGLHIQFKKKLNSSTDTVNLSSVVIAGQTITIPSPSIPSSIAASSHITEIILPLNNDSDSTLIVFNIANSSAPDSILLGYVRQAKVISKECGVYTYFQNLKVLKTSLNSDQIKVFSSNLIRDPTVSATTLTSYALNYQIFH